MVMSRRAVHDYVNRTFDSHTWVKRLSQRALRRELAQMRVPPLFKSEPWLHQLACFYLGVHYPEFMWLLDPGLGKSKIILDLMTHYMRTERAQRGLVAVPRRINLESWQNAAANHSYLEPWLVDTQDTEEKFERLLHPRGDFTCVDYPSLHLACTHKVPGKGKKPGRLVLDDKKLAALQQVYDFVAFDESHKLANPGTLWHAIADRLASTAAVRYGATGTLFGRDMMGIPAQFGIVDRGETFGTERGLYEQAFFTAKAGTWKTELTFNRGMSRTLHRMIGHRSITYEEHEVHELPPLVERTWRFELPSEQHEHYLRALEGLINAGGQLQQLDAQWFRMRQIAAGYLQWRDEFGDHELVFRDNPKLDALEGLVCDTLAGRKVVVSYEYTRTGQLIKERLEAAGVRCTWLYGGSKDPIAVKKAFVEDAGVQVLVMNSEAGGTGVDGLQDVCRYLVFYESPSNPTPRKQVLKRVYRPGQRGRTFVIDLAVGHTVDAGILDALAQDLDLYSEVMGGRAPRGALG